MRSRTSAPSSLLPRMARVAVFTRPRHSAYTCAPPCTATNSARYGGPTQMLGSAKCFHKKAKEAAAYPRHPWR